MTGWYAFIFFVHVYTLFYDYPRQNVKPAALGLHAKVEASAEKSLGDTCAALLSLRERKWGAASASFPLISVFILFNVFIFHEKNNNSKTKPCHKGPCF